MRRQADTNWIVPLLAATLISGCVRNAVGGDPWGALSGHLGSERIFIAGEGEVGSAITNALEEFRYRGMKLDRATARGYLVKGWHPTNGLVLFPFMTSGITNVPLRRATGKTVPYSPCFYITTEASVTNRTRVTVRTVVSEVIDGREPSLHGGWAHHFRRVPPIIQEEENVLDAIAAELAGREQRSKSGSENRPSEPNDRRD